MEWLICSRVKGLGCEWRGSSLNLVLFVRVGVLCVVGCVGINNSSEIHLQDANDSQMSFGWDCGDDSIRIEVK